MSYIKIFVIISWGGECQGLFKKNNCCKPCKNNIDIVKNNKGDICGQF